MAEDASLQRQRRFLFLMSIAVIAFYALGANIKADAEYGGFAISLQRPSLALWGLWIMWAWALLRYLQRIAVAWPTVWDEVKRDSVRENGRMIRNLALAYAKRLREAGKIFKDVPKDIPIESIGEPTMQPLRPRPLAMRVGEGPAIGEYYDELADGNREYEVSARLIDHIHPGSFAKSANFVFPVSRRKGRWIDIRAGLYAIFKLPNFTEHISPLVLATFVPFAPLVWR